MTDLLRLDRLTVEGTREEDGSLIITLRSKSPTFPQCCVVCTPKKLGTKAIRFRDFTIQAQPVWLEVKRQRFKCLHCDRISYETLLKHGRRTLRKADGSIPFDLLGPDEDDLLPGEAWVWSGSDLATLEADLDAGSF